MGQFFSCLCFVAKYNKNGKRLLNSEGSEVSSLIQGCAVHGEILVVVFCAVPAVHGTQLILGFGATTLALLSKKDVTVCEVLHIGGVGILAVTESIEARTLTLRRLCRKGFTFK